MADDQDKDKEMQDSVAEVVHSLARWLMQHKLDYRLFEKVGKQAFVAAATELEIESGESKVKRSSIGRRTGLTYPDILKVQKALAAQEHSAPILWCIESRVLHRWKEDAEFSVNRSPSLLPVRGRDKMSFERLCLLTGGTAVSYGQILASLVEAGSAEMIEQGSKSYVRQLKLSFGVSGKSSKAFATGGRAVSHLASTLEHNAGDPELVRVQYEAWSPNVPVAMRSLFQEMVNDRLRKQYAEIIEEMKKFEGTYEGELSSVGIGAGFYSFEQSTQWDPEKPLPEEASSSASKKGDEEE